MRRDIVPVLYRRVVRNSCLMLALLCALLVVIPRDLAVAALVAFLASTMVSAMLWPFYLRSRVRALTENDAIAFKAARTTTRGVGVNTPTFLAALLVLGLPALAYLIHPVLAAVVLGWALGVQVALAWWCRTAPARVGEDALDFVISGLAMSRPNHRLFSEGD